MPVYQCLSKIQLLHRVKYKHITISGLLQCLVMIWKPDQVHIFGTHLRLPQLWCNNKTLTTETDILKLSHKTSFCDLPEHFRKEKGFSALLGLMFLLKSIFQSPVDLFHPFRLRLFGRAAVFVS